MVKICCEMAKNLYKNTVNIICEAMDKRFKYQNDKNDEFVKVKSRKK